MDNSLLLNQNLIHQYSEEIENIMMTVRKIGTFLSLYDTKFEYKTFFLEMEFELTKLNLKYIDTILSCIQCETLNIKLLKLYDFIIYEFKRLRSKYEETNTSYFSLDEESKYVENIKNLLSKPGIRFSKMGYLFLRLNSNNLVKMYEILNLIAGKNFKYSEDTENYKRINSKQQYLCGVVYDLFILQDDNRLSEIIELNQNTMNSKLVNIFENFMKNIRNKEIFSTSNFIQTFKSGISSFIDIINEKINGTVTSPDIQLVKLIFNAIEDKYTKIHNEDEKTKVNEVIHVLCKNFTNFCIYREKEIKNSMFLNYLIKLRILSNQIIKINYGYQNLLTKKENKANEINFFGLLLKVSKDFLTPTYNVIIHIHGGGVCLQSSQSYISYLSEFTNKSDCVVISIDYHLNENNKYPIFFEEVNNMYEIIVKYSDRLFGFNINNLTLLTDTFGSLIGLDIIKQSIRKNIRVPDNTIMIYPTPLIKTEVEIFSDEDTKTYHLEYLREFSIDDRLNFFLSDCKTVSSFPSCVIISPFNSPLKENSEKLYDFLLDNKVNVLIRKCIYYSKICFLYPSLYDKYNKDVLEFSLTFLIKSLSHGNRRSLGSVSTRSSN